ncbi:MAG: hypothetical protein KAJ19_10790, partial [Gammaproteobacteria bacterium]|nr:hypothetical protein [Gammaproteobacteria bacterium]
FRNPQLKITWDLGHVTALAVTSFLTNTLEFTGVAHIMEDVSAPSGVLTLKEVYDFTSAASGDERVDMPTDYPWRTLCVRAYENGIENIATVTNLKLSADGGKFVAFDQRSQHVMEAQLDAYGELEYTRLVVFDNAETKATYMAQCQGGHISACDGTFHIVGVLYFWKSDAYLAVAAHGGGAATAINAFLTAKGTGFENCFVIPMGNKDDPSTWFQAQQYGSLDLFITQGNEAAEVQVAVQEARPY